jgi:adenine-specific DNA glycosylase
LAAGCIARRSGRELDIPRPRQRPAGRRVDLTAAIVTSGSRILLVRRQSGRLLRDWWEVPVARSAGAAPSLFDSGAPPGIAAALAARLEVAITPPRRLGRLRHSILHNVLDVTVVTATAASRRRRARNRRDAGTSAPSATPLANLDLEALECRWVGDAERHALPLTTLARKALRLARAARPA